MKIGITMTGFNGRFEHSPGARLPVFGGQWPQYRPCLPGLKYMINRWKLFDPDTGICVLPLSASALSAVVGCAWQVDRSTSLAYNLASFSSQF
jgi:hypothetical protein